ncbi:GNAT family N-acetyltransferase [Actinoplanes sp. NPDC051411]|uniref:GNAT family N-acetyltransferase n=1 Tax=Actinoplanes sp. NPDC051411 TaxID=3155522 RepID=UPI00343C5FC3
MDVSIRPRTPADLDACVAALREVHEADGYPTNWPADPAAWLTPPELAAAWVASLDDVPLAGHALLVNRPSGELELARLFVPPAARRRAVASALLAAAASVRRPLVLEVVDDGRSSAIALYEAAGWRHTHSTTAAWTTPAGAPVRLRHYELSV